MFYEREQQLTFDFYKPIYSLEIYQDDCAENPRDWSPCLMLMKLKAALYLMPVV